MKGLHNAQELRLSVANKSGLLRALQFLPLGYQVLSLVAVFSLIWFDRTAFVSELVARLHLSFGADLMWPDAYREVLQRMSLHERMCFALYAFFVLLCILVVVKLRSLQKLVVSASSGQLASSADIEEVLPAHPNYTLVIGLFSFLEAFFVVREALHNIFRSDGGVVSILGNNDGLVHVRVQVLLLWEVAQWWGVHVGLAALGTMLYRIVRDVRACRCASLRWFVICFSLFRVAVGMQSAMGSGVKYSYLALVVSTLCNIGVINHAYGPQRRVGYVTVSVGDCITFAIANTARCALVTFSALLSVLAFMVSIHVIELILLWLGVFFTSVWLPAAVASFSTDCFALMAAAVAYMIYCRSLSVASSLRAGAVFFASLTFCSSYFLMISSYLRQSWTASGLVCVGTVALLAYFVGWLQVLHVAVWVLHRAVLCETNSSSNDKILEDASSRSSSQEQGLSSWLQIISSSVDAETRKPLDSSAPHSSSVFGPLVAVLLGGVLLFAFLTRRSLPQATEPQILSVSTVIQRFVSTVVLLAIIGTSVLTGIFATRTLVGTVPPLEVRLLVAIVVGCVILGLLMDLRRPLSVHCIRVLGMSTSDPSDGASAAQAEDSATK